MDIAERLLEWGDNPQDVSHGELAEYSFVAHDEIKRLRQQNAKLLKALGYITRLHTFPEDDREVLRSVINLMRDCAENAIAKATGGE